MFEAGIKARYMMNGRSLALFFESLLPAGLRLAGVILIIAAAAAAGKREEFLPAVFSSYTAVFVFLCISGAVFLFLFSCLRQMYFNSKLYCLLERETFTPESFFNVKRLGSFLHYRLITAAKKLLWAVFYFTPAFLIAFIIYLSFAVNGYILKNTLYALIAAFVLFLVVGCCFYSVSTGRYFFCDFLFSRNPFQPPADIVKESVRLSQARLFDIFIKRLRLTVRKSVLLNPAAFPFNRVFVKCFTTALAEEYFCDRKYYSALKRTLEIRPVREKFS